MIVLARAPRPGKSAAEARPVGIALGSNLGERRDLMTRAKRAVAALHAGPGAPRVSSLYETQPVGCAPGTPAFLNAVMEIRSALPPVSLLRRLRKLERDAGRPARRTRNSPRALDLDILYAGDQRMNTARLTLPHPRAAQRRFVLQPLADISPGLVLPGRRRTVAELLAALPRQPGLRRVARTW